MAETPPSVIAQCIHDQEKLLKSLSREPNKQSEIITIQRLP